MRLASLMLASLALIADASAADRAPRFESRLVFPPHPEHNHAPGLVVCGNGDLIVSWYRGSGERRADDVAIHGARLRRGDAKFSEPFLLADTPGFPDCNTALHIDRRGRLWLFWPVILANTWESCLTSYRIASSYDEDGPPRWDWQGIITLRPDGFAARAHHELDRRLADRSVARPDDVGDVRAFRELIDSKLHQRLGWQPRCKPTELRSGRLVLPLYSDTYSASLMALSDDDGVTWRASEALIGFGNIQPSVLERADGSLVAFMRENGPIARVRVSESRDGGETWGEIRASELPNPGSGVDAVGLPTGEWVIVYNDSTEGRSSLAVSLSEDEGRSWRITRHLERDVRGKYHYPAVVASEDGTIHCVYSYFVPEGRTMKHAAFDAAWIRAGDAADTR